MTQQRQLTAKHDATQQHTRLLQLPHLVCVDTVEPRLPVSTLKLTSGGYSKAFSYATYARACLSLCVCLRV
jgi:hypothetical protein